MHELVHHHYPDGRWFPDAECPIYDVVRNNKALRRATDTMFRKNGSAFVAEISAHPVTVKGCVVGVVVTFREVTELRQQHEELRRPMNWPSGRRRSWMR
jgi:PAS domain S-box-containing protein